MTLAAIRTGLEDAAWTVTEPAFDPTSQHHTETVFTTGNGHFCLRGDFEEGYPGSRPACFMYGLWDDMPINFTELANLPRWWGIDLWVDGERFRLNRGTVLNYRRSLDLRSGVLARTVRWQPAAGGPVVDLAFERFASLAQPDLAALRVTLTVVSGTAEIRLRTGLDTCGVENTGLLHWTLVDQQTGENEVRMQVRTRATHCGLALAARVSITATAALASAGSDADGQPALERRGQLAAGERLTLEKYVALIGGPQVAETGERYAALLEATGAGNETRPGATRTAAAPDDTAGEAKPDGLDLLALAAAAVAAAQGAGYDQLRLANAAQWARRWETADVEVDGDPEAQLSLRFNMFQLLIAAPALSEHASIGAKTLSGFGYRHHVFWDTEIFMLPPFIYTQPDLARHMLMYRYHNLPGARAKARGNGFEGAQFPWESAGDGREVTPAWVTHFADPTQLVRIWTGDIEIHITADITYSILQYWRVTGDDAWLRDYGAEVVLDGARFWASAARREDDGRYHFRNVIGPDEYHDRIDDNAFTNHLVRWHLQTALDLLDWLAEISPARHAELVAALDLTTGRLAQWRTVGEAIFLPAQDDAGLIEQFTGYFGLEDADPAVLRDPNRTLSMQAILGIEGCAQTQILKQPDVLMLQYLLPDRFSPEQVRTNYDYYAPRTDHEYGSSLGPSISAIMATRVGDTAAAYEHFMRAARADLRDVRGNAGDGIHGASAGGLWQAAVFGFGGLRVDKDGWQTHPQLPAGWSRLAFKFYHRGELQCVEVT
ncbi:MAG TPA: glycoside hydrolase family 65 protein [Anaerolineae bacterium]